LPSQTPDWVLFWTCRGCTKNFVARPSTFQRLLPLLPDQTKAIDSVVLSCEACNLISAYSKDDLPVPYMPDNSDSVPRRVEVAQVSQVAISCADEDCESRIEIIAPTGRYYDKSAVKIYLKTNGSPDASVHCKHGHPPAKPIFIP